MQYMTMSRAARKPKSRKEIDEMTLEQLNAELKYLRIRVKVAGTSALAKLFQKEIAAILKVRERNFGVAPHG